MEELETLRWVSRVTEYDRDGYTGFLLRTRPRTLKIQLTHTIRKGGAVYDGNYQTGSRLKEPTELLLPSYRILLTERHFMFCLNYRPRKAQERIGLYPCYAALSLTKNWNVPGQTCYGNPGAQTGRTTAKEDYRAAKTWREKAIIAAQYLQAAEPHYGETWYRTAYAYRLGLVGKEFLET